MTGSSPSLEYEANGVRYELVAGNEAWHNRAIIMLWSRVREAFPTAQSEERYLSGYEENHEVTVRYPYYGKLVLDYVAARHEGLVLVWDLWPAEDELWEEFDVLGQLDPREPDLATRRDAKPAPGPQIRPMTLYFPRNPRGFGGLWISIFNAGDADACLPADRARPTDVPGIVYYQAYRELSDPPYLIDALEPAAVEVPAPGIHPDPQETTGQSLFPAPVKVSAPGVLPTHEQREAARRIIRTTGSADERE